MSLKIGPTVGPFTDYPLAGVILGPVMVQAAVASASPEAGILSVVTPTTFSARGGGTVTVTHSLRLDGVEIGTSTGTADIEYTWGLSQVGQVVTLQSEATESGGTNPGVTERTVSFGPVAPASAGPLWVLTPQPTSFIIEQSPGYALTAPTVAVVNGLLEIS